MSKSQKKIVAVFNDAGERIQETSEDSSVVDLYIELIKKGLTEEKAAVGAKLLSEKPNPVNAPAKVIKENPYVSHKNEKHIAISDKKIVQSEGIKRMSRVAFLIEVVKKHPGISRPDLIATVHNEYSDMSYAGLHSSLTNLEHSNGTYYGSPSPIVFRQGKNGTGYYYNVV